MNWLSWCRNIVKYLWPRPGPMAVIQMNTAFSMTQKAEGLRSGGVTHRGKTALKPSCPCDVASSLAASWLFTLELDGFAPLGSRRFACNCPWFAYCAAVELIDWLCPSGVSVRCRQIVRNDAMNYSTLYGLNETTLTKPSVTCRTIFLVLLFSQYARNVHFPLPVYKAKKGWTSYRLQVFKMFPVSKKMTSICRGQACGSAACHELSQCLIFWKWSEADLPHPLLVVLGKTHCNVKSSNMLFFF